MCRRQKSRKSTDFDGMISSVRREIHVTKPLDPIISEFATEEQAASHDHWFRAKVQASLDDPRPSIPHDEAMARIRKTINDAARLQKRH